MKNNLRNLIDTNTLAIILEKLCCEKYGTVNEALKVANLDKSTIFTISNGSIPNIATIKVLATFLNVSTDYLLGLTDSPTPAQTPSELSQIQTLFDMLNRDNKISALGYIEGMLSEQGYTHGELVRISPALDS
jgi:hypothetical protein